MNLFERDAVGGVTFLLFYDFGVQLYVVGVMIYLYLCGVVTMGAIQPSFGSQELSHG